MSVPFVHIFGEENVSEREADLDAYSYSAGELVQKPKLVVWPEDALKVARFLRETNQSRGLVIIRGAGTSTGNSTVGQNAIILSSEKMNKILKFDQAEKRIEVQSGATIYEINRALSETEFTVPFTPFNPAATIGGLFAIDSFARESEVLGRFSNVVEEFEFVDGTGKIYTSTKKELVAGKEGLTGFITKLRLKLIHKPTLSLDVFQFDELHELMRAVLRLKNDKERYFAEFIDKEIAKAFGFESQYTLVVAYTTLKGRYRSFDEVTSLFEKIDCMHSRFREQKYYFILDPLVSAEKAYDLINWCESKKIPLHGHAGALMFYAYFKKDEKNKMNEFRAVVKSVGGKLGKCFGTGPLNSDFISAEEKKALVKLKDEHDYNNTLNPGKMISYR